MSFSEATATSLLAGGKAPLRPDFAYPPLVQVRLSVGLIVGGAASPAQDSPPGVTRSATEWATQGAQWLTQQHVDWQRLPDPQPGIARLRHVLGDRVVQVCHSMAAASSQTPGLLELAWLSSEGQVYPRYESVRDNFVSLWESWPHAEGAHLAALQPWRWTVEYVNRMQQGTVWHRDQDFSFCRWSPSFEAAPPLPNDWAAAAPTRYYAEQSWQLEPGSIGLTYCWAGPFATADHSQAIEITLRTSGQTAPGEHLLGGFDQGRNVIVQAFAEMMSPEAQTYWGVRRRPR